MTLPPGWRKKESKKRKGYFYYISPEGKTQWEKPSEEDTKKRRREVSGDTGVSNGKKPKGDENKVSVLHLLKKHNKSRRPSSWREKNITRSKEEAVAELKELREEITGEAKRLSQKEEEYPKRLREIFEAHAEVESDCSSAKRKGDLGPFGRGKMQPSFEKASFGLKVGELSGVVESQSGVHIILRYK